MEKENNEFNIENKHLRALSCIFFLWPIVPMALQRWDYNLKNGDMEFIQSYVKYWTALDVAFVIYIILSAYNYMNYSEFMYYVVNIILFGIIWALFFGIYLIFKGRRFESLESEITYTKIKPWNTNLLFYYAPIYNLWLWYESNKDMKSYRWIKESITFLTLFVIFNFISQFFSYSLTTFINVIFIWLYIFRLVSLLGGMDVVSDQVKEELDGLFDMNPEEIFAYPKWAIIFVYLKAKAKNLEINTTLSQQIDKEKKVYKEINYFQKEDWKVNKFLISQYAILAILVLTYLYYNFWRFSFDILGLIYLLPWVLFICRYLMIIFTKKASYIPVIYELVNFVWRLFKFLK